MDPAIFLILSGTLAVLESTVLWRATRAYENRLRRSESHRNSYRQVAFFRWTAIQGIRLRARPWYRPAMFVLGVASMMGGLLTLG
jgi:hypothetical protein